MDLRGVPRGGVTGFLSTVRFIKVSYVGDLLLGPSKSCTPRRKSAPFVKFVRGGGKQRHIFFIFVVRPSASPRFRRHILYETRARPPNPPPPSFPSHATHATAEGRARQRGDPARLTFGKPCLLCLISDGSPTDLRRISDGSPAGPTQMVMMSFSRWVTALSASASDFLRTWG